VGGCAREVDGPDDQEGAPARQAQRECVGEAVQEDPEGGELVYFSLPGGQEYANYRKPDGGGHHQRCGRAVLLAGHLRVRPQRPGEGQAQGQDGQTQSQTGALQVGGVLARFAHI